YGIARQGLQEGDCPRHLESSQPLGNKCAQLGRRRRSSGPQYDRSADIFAECLVGQGKCRRRADGRMTEQRIINFPDVHFLAAAIDEFLDAAGQVEISCRIEASEISGAEPAFAESFGVCARIVFISRKYVWTPDCNFAFRPLRYRFPILRVDLEFRAILPAALSSRTFGRG